MKKSVYNILALPAIAATLISCGEKTTTTQKKQNHANSVSESVATNTDWSYQKTATPSFHHSDSYESLNRDMQSHYSEWDTIVTSTSEHEPTHLNNQRLQKWKSKNRQLQSRINGLSLSNTQLESLDSIHSKRFNNETTDSVKKRFPSLSKEMAEIQAPPSRSLSVTKTQPSHQANPTKASSPSNEKVSSPPKKSSRSFTVTPTSSKPKNGATGFGSSKSSSPSSSSTNSTRSSSSRPSTGSSSSSLNSSSSRSSNRSSSKSSRSGSRRK